MFHGYGLILCALALCAPILGNGAATAAGKRIFEFPSQTVGDLADISFNKNDGTYDIRYFAKARGRVVIPDGIRCGLEVNYVGAQDLTFINKLPRDSLAFLRCDDFEVSDREFMALKNLGKLKVLEMAQSDITDTGFKHIANSPELEELIMPSCLLRGGTFASLKFVPHLRRFIVDHNRLNDQCLSNLRYLKQLHMIRLQACEIGDAGLNNLRALPAIEDIDVAQNRRITDKSIDTFLACRNIFRLDLNDTSITADGVLRLSKLPKLTQLAYSFSRLSAAQNARIRKALPHCQLLDGHRDSLPLELFK